MVYQRHKSDESIENYLEAILMLTKELPQVRSIDIVRKLGYSKPSISVAMKNLKQQDLIDMSDCGYITLTASGLKRAEAVLERHTLISNWLIFLGVDSKTATEDACKMEHDMSPESFTAIKKFLQETYFNNNT